MEVRERKLLDETYCIFVVRVGFAGKTRDDISAQADSRHGIGDLERPGSVRLSRMPAFHPAEDRIGTALQRHVYVRCDTATRRTNEIEEEVVDLRGLDAPDAEPDVRNGVQEASEEH